MDSEYEKARYIWRDRSIPVLVKPPAGESYIDGKLKLRFPEDDLGWPFLVDRNHHRPYFDLERQRWEVCRARFNQLVADILERWRKLYVIQYFREQKKCAPACRTAKGFDCVCACGGEFHGVDGPPGEWLDISEAFSVKRSELYLSCRLLTRREDVGGVP